MTRRPLAADTKRHRFTAVYRARRQLLEEWRTSLPLVDRERWDTAREGRYALLTRSVIDPSLLPPPLPIRRFSQHAVAIHMGWPVWKVHRYWPWAPRAAHALEQIAAEESAWCDDYRKLASGDPRVPRPTGDPWTWLERLLRSRAASTKAPARDVAQHAGRSVRTVRRDRGVTRRTT